MPWGEAREPRPYTAADEARLPPVINPPPSPSFADTLAELADTLGGVVELCAGHRARMLEAGHSEDAANLGALHLHNEMLTKLIRR